MGLVRSGLREARQLEPGDGSTRGHVAWGHQWAKANAFELTDEVAGEIGWLYWHGGGQVSKNRNDDHLVQHARERGGSEVRVAPKADAEVVSPFDWEKWDAKNASYVARGGRRV